MMPLKVGNGKEHPDIDHHVQPETEPWLPGVVPEISDVEPTMPPRMSEDQKMNALMMAALERMIVRLDAPTSSSQNGNGKWLMAAIAIAGLGTGAFGIQFMTRSQGNSERQMEILNYRVEQSEKREAGVNDRIDAANNRFANLRQQLSLVGIELDEGGKIISIHGKPFRRN